MEALDRFADLGVDGFRFDLAACSPATPTSCAPSATGPSAAVCAWSPSRGTSPRYLLGAGLPGRAMDAVERPVPRRRARLPARRARAGADARRSGSQGSPDLFDLADADASTSSPPTTGSRCTTSSPTTVKHNEANGWDNTDGTDDNRSWNCGWEGDVDVPDEVMELRRRQLRNAMCLLLLSHGVPMFVAGRRVRRGRRAATTTPTTRTTRPRGSTGSGGRARRPRALRRATCWRCGRRTRCCGIHSGGGAASTLFGVDGDPDTRPRVTLDRLGRRRPLRDGQHVVGAGRVRRPGARRLATSSIDTDNETDSVRRRSVRSPMSGHARPPLDRRARAGRTGDVSRSEPGTDRDVYGVEAETDPVEGAQPGIALAGLVLAVHRPARRLDPDEPERLGRERQRLRP